MLENVLDSHLPARTIGTASMFEISEAVLSWPVTRHLRALDRMRYAK